MIGNRETTRRRLSVGEQPPSELVFSNQTGAVAFCGVARELALGVARAERQQLRQQQSPAAARQSFYGSGGGGPSEQRPSGAAKIRIHWERDTGEPVEQVVYATSNSLGAGLPGGQSTTSLDLAELATGTQPQFSAERHALLHHHAGAGGRPLRWVRPVDGALVFEPFRGHEYRPDVHAATYRCVASLAAEPQPPGGQPAATPTQEMRAGGPATLVSGEMRVRAVVLQQSQSSGQSQGLLQTQHGQQTSAGGSLGNQLEVLDELVLEGNLATFRCHIPSHLSAYVQPVDWVEYPGELVHTVQSTSLEGPLLSASSQTANSSTSASASAFAFGPAFLGPNESDKKNRPFVHPKTRQLHVANAHQAGPVLRSYRCRCRNRLTGELLLSSQAGRLVVSDSRVPIAPRLSSHHAAGLSSLASLGSLGSLGAPSRLHLGPQAGPQQQQQQAAATLLHGRPNAAQLAYLEGEPLAVLVCQLQAFPRAQIRWFRRLPVQTGSGRADEQLAASEQLGETEAGALEPVDLRLTLAQSLSGATGSATEGQQQRPEQTKQEAVAKYSQVEPGGHLLLVRRVGRNDSGRYVCVARNVAGEERFEQELQVRARLRVQLRALGNKGNLLELGGSLALECRVFGFPVGQLLLKHNGHTIKSVSGSSQLASEAAAWRQRQASSSGELAAASDEPQDERDEQEAAHLLPEASGGSGDRLEEQRVSSEPSWWAAGELGEEEQWSSSASLGDSLGRAEGEQTGALVALVEPQRTGAFQCEASNQLERAHASLLLKVVHEPPSFRDTFGARVYELREDISLLCSARANPIPQINWLLDGQPLVESGRVRIGDFVTRDKLVVSYVNISQAQVLDSALYRCTANNGLAQIEHEAQISVLGGPLVKPMPNVTVLASTTFRQRCPVAGFPVGEVVWLHAGRRLPANHRQRVHPNGTLEVEHMERSAGDEGEYTCMVSAGQPAGSAAPREQQQQSQMQSQMQSQSQLQAASSSVQVSIRVRPSIEPFSVSRALREGQRASIMCTISSGDLPISIQWFRDGHLLLPVGGDSTQSAQVVVQQPGQQLAQEQGRQLSQAQQVTLFTHHQDQQQLNMQQHLQQPLHLQQSQTTLAQESEQRPEVGGVNQEPQVPLAGVRISRVSDYSSTLLFESLLAQHSANYTCLATNEAGSVSHQAPMVVQGEFWLSFWRRF